MIGSLQTENREVAVVGGGAAGMFAAYFLDKYGYQVTLFEATDRLGGVIKTDSSPFGLVESAANSLLGSPALFELTSDLNIELEPLNPNAKGKFISYRGKMCSNPFTLFEMLGLAYSFVFKRVSQTPITMRELAENHFGSKVADYAVEPMITGIYGAKASDIAVAAAFPHLQLEAGRTPYHSIRANKRHQPYPGQRKIFAPKGGMGVLFSALERHLQERLGSRLQFCSAIETLPDFDNIILCTPASVASRIVRQESSILSSKLQQVLYTPMISIGVFVSNKQLKRVPQGLGILVPPAEKRSILGILFTSSSFPSRIVDPEVSLMTVMMGGGHRPDLLSESDQKIKTLIKAELKHFFGLEGEPLHIVIHRWEEGIPVYSESLMQIWRTARENWSKPGRVLFGNYTGEVSLRGMLESAAKLAHASRSLNL